MFYELHIGSYVIKEKPQSHLKYYDVKHVGNGMSFCHNSKDNQPVVISNSKTLLENNIDQINSGFRRISR